MSLPLWERLRPLLDAGRADQVARLVSSVDEPDRLSAARPLEAYVKQLNQRSWDEQGKPVASVAVAAVGCLPSAARAGALLCRRDVRWHWHGLRSGLMIEVATAREIDWLGALAVRMAAKLDNDSWSPGWRPVADLILAGQAALPANESFVRGWLTDRSAPQHNRRPVVLVDKLRDDPFLDALLPAVFEIDGIGDAFGRAHGWNQATKEYESTPIYPAALVTLAAEGRVDRGLLLDGCVSRFLRGDRPGSLRTFVILHDALEPTLDELVARRLDYVRLLSEAPSTVAQLAQRALKPVDDAGRLELETLLDASAAVLLRDEKGLVRKQLTWLDRLVRRHPGRAGEVLATIATACGHPTLDVQERALAGLARHRGRVDPAVLESVVGPALEQLDVSLHARAGELLGVTVAAPEPVPVWAPAVASTPVPMPPPIGSPAELAEELAALTQTTSVDAPTWERVLAALVSLRATDPAGLTEALAPVLDRYSVAFGKAGWNPPIRGELGEAIRAAVGSRERGSRWQRTIAAVRGTILGPQPGVPESKISPSPRRVLALRLAEITVQLDRAPVPALVATPTSANGQLDAATLVDRLARAEEAGWQPWRIDLEQAMLRVSPEFDPLVAKRAGELRSPAGRQLVDWLETGGLPAPTSIRTEQRYDTRYYAQSSVPGRRLVVGLTPTGPSRGFVDEMLCELKPTNRIYHTQYRGPAIWWPAVLPHHREVIAAWSLADLAAMADDSRDDGRLLPVLAECGGPVGPAMSLALIYTLAARQEADRVAGVDAFITLAADPVFDPAAVGRELGGLAADSTIKIGRVVPGLADAARAGAGPAVWEVIAAALPSLLAVVKPPPGTPDLLSLGAQTAAALGRRAPIEAVAAVAARGGSSRLVTEARRLNQTLTP